MVHHKFKSDLIDLHDAVYLPDEPETGKEPDRARQQIEQEHHDEGVAEIQERRRRVLDLQLGEEVMATVEKEIDCGETGREIRAPPPMVVLGTQVEIAQQNRGFRASYHQNDEHQEQKAEHVVQLRRPDGIQNEEQLDEDASKRQNSSHDDPGNGLGVDGLLRDQPGDLIRPHRMLQCLKNREHSEKF